MTQQNFTPDDSKQFHISKMNTQMDKSQHKIPYDYHVWSCNSRDLKHSINPHFIIHKCTYVYTHIHKSIRHQFISLKFQQS